ARPDPADGPSGAPSAAPRRPMLPCTEPTLRSSQEHRMTEPSSSWHFDSITYAGGSREGPRASVQLTREGKQVHAEGSGNGLIDAVCDSIPQSPALAGREGALRAS